MSAAAAAEADRAHRIACEAMMPAYQHASATISEMRSYSDCIALIYPDETSSDQVIFMLILACLLGAVVGFAIAKRERDPVLVGLGTLLGAVIGLVLVGVIQGIRFCIQFLVEN